MELPPIGEQSPKFDELECADISVSYEKYKGVFYKK